MKKPGQRLPGFSFISNLHTSYRPLPFMLEPDPEEVFVFVLVFVPLPEVPVPVPLPDPFI
jgi:hypothetical protein